MGPAVIIVMAPALDEDLGLEQGVEDLAVEQLVAQLAVEAFIVSVLPGTFGLDIEGLNPNPGEPCLDGLGRELAAVVATNGLRVPL